MAKRSITTDAIQWLITKIQGIKVNGKVVGKDGEITLTASDVNALSTSSGSVTTDHLANGAVTTAKLNFTVPTLSSIYPVGAIYLSTVSTSPASLFGGTWQQITGRFLLAAGDGYTAGNTGGEAAHALSAGEMPSHSHNLIEPTNANNSIKWGTMAGSDAWALSKRAASYDYNLSTNNAGGGAAHNNMPPYLVVYVWKRTA